MEKRLIGLYVPAVQERFDVLLPADIEIGNLIQLLADGVCELSQGRFTPSRQETLSRKEELSPPDGDQNSLRERHKCLPLQPDRTLAAYGIADGEQLVLV